MQKMKAAIFVEPGRIVLDEKPVPDVGPLHALVALRPPPASRHEVSLDISEAFCEFARRPLGFIGRHLDDAPADIGRLGPAFWRVVAIASVFTLARFSEAFLILKAQAVGLPIAMVPASMRKSQVFRVPGSRLHVQIVPSATL